MRLIFILVSIFSCVFTYSFEAKISVLKGDVFVDGKLAKVGEVLKVNQVVEAKGSKSFFVASYTDGTKFMIKNAKLKISKISKQNSQIDLLEGTIFVKASPSTDKKKNNNFEKLVIKTRTAALGVRGTMFYVTEEKDNSYLCVCEGVVEARDLSGFSLLVNKYEDINIYKENKSLKKRTANQQMISMGEEVFSSF